MQKCKNLHKPRWKENLNNFVFPSPKLHTWHSTPCLASSHASAGKLAQIELLADIVVVSVLLTEKSLAAMLSRPHSVAQLTPRQSLVYRRLGIALTFHWKNPRGPAANQHATVFREHSGNPLVVLAFQQAGLLKPESWLILAVTHVLSAHTTTEQTLLELLTLHHVGIETLVIAHIKVQTQFSLKCLAYLVKTYPIECNWSLCTDLGLGRKLGCLRSDYTCS